MTIRNVLKRGLRAAGLEVHRLVRPRLQAQPSSIFGPAVQAEPIWPLPRRAGISDAEITAGVSAFRDWHYALEFQNGPSFPSMWTKPGSPDPHAQRLPQRFRHFMPAALAAAGGDLKGKRVLDIACNGGFWSLQCALLGAEVTAFDSRPELLEQTRLLFRIAGLAEPRLQVLDYWAMTPASLGGSYDLVLNLGILYHLPDPLAALRLALAMSREVVVLDTMVSRSTESVVKLIWEEPDAIFNAVTPGIVAYPSRSSVEMMLRQLGAKRYQEIPLSRLPMPQDYLSGDRTSWVIEVR